MRDKIELMVSRICGIFSAFQLYPLITQIIELVKKRYGRDYTGRHIASSMIGIFSITYAHSAFNCHFDRMNVQPITVQTQY